AQPAVRGVSRAEGVGAEQPALLPDGAESGQATDHGSPQESPVRSDSLTGCMYYSHLAPLAEYGPDLPRRLACSANGPTTATSPGRSSPWAILDAITQNESFDLLLLPPLSRFIQGPSAGKSRLANSAVRPLVIRGSIASQ